MAARSVPVIAAATATVMPDAQEAVTKPASPPVRSAIDRAGVAVQRGHVEELGQAPGHRIDRFGHRDRGAERRHGAGDVDDLAETEFGADVVGHVNLKCVGQSGQLRRPAVDLVGVAMAPAGRLDAMIAESRSATVSASPG